MEANILTPLNFQIIMLELERGYPLPGSHEDGLHLPHQLQDGVAQGKTQTSSNIGKQGHQVHSRPALSHMHNRVKYDSNSIHNFYLSNHSGLYFHGLARHLTVLKNR